MVKHVLLAFLVGVGLTLWLNVATSRHEPPQAAWPAPVESEGRITINGPDDVPRLRARLATAVFGGSLPDGMPGATRAPSPFPEATAATQLATGAHLLTTATPNGKLAIYHSGHKETVLEGGRHTIRAMLTAGFDVLALSMPAEPHNRFANTARPLRPFLEPVALSLNYALARTPYTEVVMAGLSGGGWTTVVYAALDTRIDRSYPIAGSWPFYLRKLRADSAGDFEQQLPGLDVGYLDLYLLAASEGREQLQIFNRADPCCFSGELPLTYHAEVKRRAEELGGTFGMVIDANDEHTLSPGLTRLIWR